MLRLKLQTMMVSAIGLGSLNACALAQEVIEQSVDPDVTATVVMTDLAEFSCRDLVLQSGDDRDLSVAFVLGYFAGQSDSTVIDSERLSLAGELLLEECVDQPTSKVLPTLAAALDALAPADAD